MTLHLTRLAAVDGAGPAPLGLAIGDTRGVGRVAADASLASLALDRAAGVLRASSAGSPLLGLDLDGDVSWVAAYVPGTNVLETVGHADGVELRVADFMSVAEGRPGQPEAMPAGRFIRIVSCTEGSASFRLVCAGRVVHADKHEATTDDGWFMACSRALGAEAGADSVATHVHLAAGESVAFVIADAPVQGGPALAAGALHALGDTIHYWAWWSDRCRYKGEDFDARLREALELKLLCSEAGLVVDEPGSLGFVRAPCIQATRAAAAFLDLGYRGECVSLLAQVVEQAAQGADHERWSFDDAFLRTLEAYVLRYGTLGLPEGLRQVADASAPVLQCTKRMA
ncbi:hypothetical protein FIV34_03325 [Luteibacter pinisoli]|uniref:Uncharacterized protein n=1 Tax=Luteibacter pinisoli TaxID=2589080 RepID=A0A4Y5YZE8_9GAMM|nr:hypothetical protein [Luteibacter pinisoli]QDE38301.1 hypothetical protein FIV34_03325 [Luteibacter pinisoli]